MPDEILSLGIDARPAEEGGRRYARTIDEVTGANARADDSTGKLEERFRSFSRTTAEGTRSLTGWVLHHSLLLGAVSSLSGGLSRLTGGTMSAFFALAARGSGVLSNLTTHAIQFAAKGLRGISAAVGGTNGSMSQLAQILEIGAAGMEKYAGIMLRFNIVTLAVAGTLGVLATAIAKAGFAAAEKFEPGWNRVLTIIGNTRGADALRKSVSDLAGEMGVAGEAATGGLYQTLSAMPDLAKDTAGAMEVLTPALEAASTGFTDATTAVGSITGTLNAFHLAADRATEVSDALFYTQNAGVTTFGEVAGSIGTAADLVSSLGASYKDLLAVVIPTLNGTASTQERMTQLRGALSAIIKPTEQAKQALAGTGVELSAAAVETQGLTGYLRHLIEVTHGNPDVLAQVFPQETLPFMLLLARNVDGMRESLDGLNRSAGLTARAVDQMNDGFDAQARLLTEKKNAILRDAAGGFESLATAVLKAANAYDKYYVARSKQTDIRERAGDPIQQIAGRESAANPTRLAAVLATPPTGRGAPAPEATTLDYAQKKIEDFGASLRASSVRTLAATGDWKAYDAAVKSADEAVNRLVVSEMKRLSAAGVEADQVNQLATLYRDTYQEAREAEQKRLKALEDTRKEMEHLTAATQTYRSVVATPLTAPTSGGIALTEDARDRYFADTQAKATTEPDMVLHTISVAQPTAPRVGFFDRARSAAGQFAGGDLKGGLGTLGVGLGTLAIAAAALAPVFKGLKDVLEPVLSKLAHPLEVMGRILGDVVTPVLELLQGPLEAVATLFSVLAQPLKLSAEIITAFVAPGLNLLGKVLKAITGGLSYIIEGIGYVVKGLGELVDKLVPDFISHAGKGLAKTGQEIIDGAERARHGFDAVATASDKLAASLSTDLPRAILSALYRARIGAPAGGGTVGGGAVGGGGPVAGGPIGGGYHPPVYTPGNHPQPAPGGVVISIGQYHSAANETPEDAARKMAKGAQILNSRGEKLYAPGLVVAA